MKPHRRGLAVLAAMLAATTAFADARDDYNRRNAERLHELFRLADANRDGVVTRQEATGSIELEARFDDIDVGRDGAISREELQHWLEAVFR